MIILKDALVFTLNPKDDFGRRSILVVEDHIEDIAKSDSGISEQTENTKLQKWLERYPDALIVDCRDKMIMPPLINSCEKSEGVFIKYLLRKRHYENTDSDLYTDFIFNYIYQELQTEEMKSDLTNIYNYSFQKNLKSGVCMLNEFTLRKDFNHLSPIMEAQKLSGQRVSVCYPIRQDNNTLHQFKDLRTAYYVTDEDQLTIYDISLINELRNNGVKKLFLEVSTNKEVTDKFRRVFNKPVIKLFDEYNLINEDTSVINPLYLTYDEIKILSEKRANLIICPSDLMYFTNRYFPFDEFLSQNINFSIATGWLGDDLFREMRVLRNRYKELNLKSTGFLSSVTQRPKLSFFSDEPENGESYCLAPHKPADLIFIDLSDLRFQFFSESTQFEHICEFIIDNLSSENISDVMINGDFCVKDRKLLYSDEEAIIQASELTRQKLYRLGKYEEITERNKHRSITEMLDLRNRDDEEIKLFSEAGKENTEDVVSEGKPEFKIKGKIPSFRDRTQKTQKNLFELEESNNIIQSEEDPETPVINLLYTEIDQSKSTDDEVTYSRIADIKILKYSAGEKKEQSKISSPESKIELPKNVKLKFGDD